jgi:hypothetical protein
MRYVGHGNRQWAGNQLTESGPTILEFTSLDPLKWVILTRICPGLLMGPKDQCALWFDMSFISTLFPCASNVADDVDLDSPSIQSSKYARCLKSASTTWEHESSIIVTDSWQDSEMRNMDKTLTPATKPLKPLWIGTLTVVVAMIRQVGWMDIVVWRASDSGKQRVLTRRF